MSRGCKNPSVKLVIGGIALLLVHGQFSPFASEVKVGQEDSTTDDWKIQTPKHLSEEELEAYMKEQVKKRTQELDEQRAARKAARKKERERYDPKTMSSCDFSTPECWEDFYKMHHENFDWYNTPARSLQPHLAPFGAPARLLHVGSGSSTWTGLLADLPEVDTVMNVDINQEVIDRMRQQYQSNSRLSFAVMDVMNMTFADNSFDAVVDKGLMDVFRPNGDDFVAGVFKELSRVLRPGGRLIYVSYAGPERQAAVLAKACSVHPAQDEKASMYVCVMPAVGAEDESAGSDSQENPGRIPDEL